MAAVREVVVKEMREEVFEEVQEAGRPRLRRWYGRAGLSCPSQKAAPISSVWLQKVA